MIEYEARLEWQQYVIAQDDDNDDQESGYIAAIKDGRAALTRYSHCSCYGTRDYVDENLEKWDWSGTPQELLTLAERGCDPDMPSRQASPDDCDYEHLIHVYNQIIAYFAKQQDK